MPDITMCVKKNNKCKVKKDCYRYIAKPNKYQSYSNFWHEYGQRCCEFLFCERGK